MPASSTLSERVGAYVSTVRYEDLSPSVVRTAKDLIIYHLGLAFTGARQPAGEAAIRVAERLGSAGPCRVIGRDGGHQPLDAAFANCTLMRANGRDDVLFPVGVHAGLVTIPPALAFGEACHRNGRDVLAAIVAGYEVIGVLGRSIWAWDGTVPRRPTIPFGPFGAAAVSARLLGLDSARAAHAIGYAAHSAMGLAIGDLVTHYYSLVARNGMLGAILAEEGGRAADDVLEGRNGFYESFFGVLPAAIDGAVAELGREPEIRNATTKRYDGTALNIVPIELTLDLVARHGVRPPDVREIRICLPEERANFRAGHSLGPFATPSEMASSAAFQVSAILHDGGLRDDRFIRGLDGGSGEILRRTRIELEPGHPIRYARLEIDLIDGRTIAAEGSDHVFPPEEPQTWLARDGSHFVDPERLADAVALVESLEELDDLGRLTQLLTPGSD